MATDTPLRLFDKTSNVDATLTLADEVITQAINDLRIAAGLDAKVQTALDALEDVLLASLYASRASGPDATRALIRDAQRRIDAAYESVADAVDQAMQGLAAIDGQAAARAVMTALDRVGVVSSISVSLAPQGPSEQVLKTLAKTTLIDGAPSAAWWERQAGDTAFRFAQVVRQGIANGQSTGQIAARVAGTATQPGVMTVSKASARKLVHQSVQTVAGASRMATFREMAHLLNGVMQVTTLDNRTSDICMAYSGGQWDLQGKPIHGTTLPFRNPGGAVDGVPRHWNCRSQLVPLVKTFEDLGVDLPEPEDGMRAAQGGPVAANLTFEQWLRGKSAAFVDELLGKGRADLWRRKVITLQQLLDQRGNPLTLAELKRRYERA